MRTLSDPLRTVGVREVVRCDLCDDFGDAVVTSGAQELELRTPQSQL